LFPWLNETPIQSATVASIRREYQIFNNLNGYTKQIFNLFSRTCQQFVMDQTPESAKNAGSACRM